MHKFDTRKVDAINGKELVEELLIDGKSQIDSFEDELKGSTYLSELEDLLVFIEHIANGGNPGRKMKILKKPTPGGTEFEFISKHLRLYAVQMPSKKIILFGGKKKAADSHDNIAEFRRVKEKFINSTNSTLKKDKL
jgi:hypothetical protein